MKSDKVYKVEWNDIEAHSNEVLKEPYTQFLAPSWTIGYVEESDDVIIVKYGGNEGECCFDAIPKSVVTKITKI